MIAFFTGFFLGISLIVAIGAQNAFVLRQGILRQHVFYIALFCSISDSILIGFGVLGIAYLFENIIFEYSKIIFGFAALWLFIYGISRLHSAIKFSSVISVNNSNTRSLFSMITVISILTFANPHVYLDTMILIGSISQQFTDINRVYFLAGACSASFVWFFSLAYGAKFLTPFIQKPKHWRILDAIIAIIMFVIAFNLASHGGWF